MQLHSPTFHVELAALSRVDDEDWTRVHVEVQSGGFSGDFEAWLQSGDLDFFSKQLAALYEKAGQPGEAILQCAERGIMISLSMQTMGGIEGKYEFFDEHRQRRGMAISRIFLGSIGGSCHSVLLDGSFSNRQKLASSCRTRRVSEPE